MDYDDIDQKYEKETYNVDNLDDTDIKINPSYYIHKCLIQSQYVLSKENMKEGFLQFIILTNYLESLCKSSNLVPENYEDKIKQARALIEEEEKDSDEYIKKVKLAQKKQELLLKEIFDSKTITAPIKM